MKKRLTLWIILIIAIVGLLFSGFLTYTEMLKACILGSCNNIAGVPACVYGFFMYLAIFIISIIGLRSKK